MVGWLGVVCVGGCVFVCFLVRELWEGGHSRRPKLNL